jgi:hypothetical protein
MPTPKAEDIQAFLKEALLKEGFIKQTSVNGVYTTDPTQLPGDMERLVKALSSGLAAYWGAWQGQVTVVIPVTSTPGSPSVGVGPWVGGSAPTPQTPGVPRVTPPPPGGLV